MISYPEAFRSAHEFSSLHLGTELNPAFPISETWTCNMKELSPKLARVLAYHFDSVGSVDNHCLFATMILSLCLCGQGIPHAVTVGDVEYDDGNRYTKASEGSLLEDVKKGFVVKFVDGYPELEPAHAHSWITLPNGDIIDPTITPHIDVLRGTTTVAPFDFEDAIFGLRNRDPRVSKHIPMLTGLKYHLRVATGINHILGITEENYHAYQQWRGFYLDIMNVDVI